MSRTHGTRSRGRSACSRRVCGFVLKMLRFFLVLKSGALTSIPKVLHHFCRLGGNAKVDVGFPRMAPLVERSARCRHRYVRLGVFVTLILAFE